MRLPKSRLKEISTHALTEGDEDAVIMCAGRKYFNSRPHGGRQNPVIGAVKLVDISTHALTEGDWLANQTPDLILHFNSRPHGGRQQI